ncbi:MAG TPA: hypothetical protein VH583_04815 [Vicinamibacterales bacterium]|jgi:hypothetical protein
MKRSAVVFVCAALVLAPAATFAQQPPAQADATELAKKTQNPVGDLVSVPFQFNFNTGGDLQDATFFNLNFQPVIPFKLTDDINVIGRFIVPIDSVPGSNGVSYSGVGDIQAQLYLTPSHPGKIIWGVGPVFSLPTATAPPLRTGTWAAGVGAVGLTMSGPWVLGALVNQYWPLSDTGGEPETNLFLVQPFVNFNFGQGWALSYAPIITANWDASSGNRWTVPIGAGITRTAVFNKRPMNLGVQYYGNAVKPDGSAGYQLRFVVALLYPE